MSQNSIPLSFILNGKKVETTCEPGQNLLSLLRSLGMYSVKNGCSEGDCGMCTVLINNQPITSCMTKAQDVQGKEIITLEGLSSRHEIHPIQQAFIETGAIQCGYCTPAQILTAKALLDKNPKPSREEIGEALSGVLCRCTGYVKIIDAVERAAQWLRGEPVPEEIELPPTYTPPEMSKYEELQVVGKPVQKVDAVKLAKGYPVFTDDYTMPGMLYGALLTSPHAHARIKNIDTSKAKALPGVHAVLTYKDIPRVKYASGGQSYPQPEPYDQVSLDNKVRYVGDRVAVVAAETPQIAERALRLIEVEYEVLPHVLDPIEAMKDGAPVIHDEDDSPGIYDAKHNIVYHIEAEVGKC
jgi:putative selenate reductase molybdopterin-binding subunit